MSEVVILLGIGRSGKTTFARTAFKNHEYIGIDKWFSYNKGIAAWHDFVRRFTKHLNEHSDQDFVLDGYINACTDQSNGTRIYTGHGFSCIQTKLNCHTIRPIVVVESIEHIHSRSEAKKANIESRERISWLYAWFLTMRGIDTIVLGSGSNPVISNRDRAMSIVLGKDDLVTPTKVGSKHILRRLAKRKAERAPHHGDPYYQTVELTDGHIIQGYNRNYEHQTWKKVAGLLSVKGRSVGEVGCHHGYYLLQLKEQGAGKVVGYDFNPYTVESATQIAHFRELDVNYVQLDIDREELPQKFDLMLVMNVVRHFKMPVESLRRIFNSTKCQIVFETQFDIKALLGIAKLHAFELTHTVDSARPERTVLIMERK
ncbi:MAG: class I SAM-dependent methyltransferase [Candidatus Thorarchaeota archaeon]